MTSSLQICGKPIEEFLATVERFHGWKAPGLVLGGFMVDLARERVGANTEADAMVETRHCLPDAVQLLTPCTIGNGWLKVLDWDKFALSLYDRHTLFGYRVWLDLGKTRGYPKLYGWYMREIPKKDLPLDLLLSVILTAGRNVLSSAPIRVVRYFERVKKGETGVCTGCGEAYPV
jgi:formylmethanofuran dehydrogenase subunit E